MKNTHPKFRVSTITLLMFIAGLAHGATLPSGPGASSGVTGIATSGNTMTITTNANKSIQNWNNFSVGSGGTVQINQPNNSSIMLNRVTGGTMSQVYGTINSNGGVWLVNPQGIYFGPGSVVNAGSVLLSTLNITDSSFSSNGSYIFTPSGSSGSIGMDGAIQASSLVAVSPSVRQGASGVIGADKEVHLIASDNARLAIDGSGLIVANLNRSAAQTILNTQGAIRTTNGSIELTAMGQAMAAEALVTVGGVVLTQGRNNNIYINSPYGGHSITGAVSPGPGGILTVNYQSADDAGDAADKKQAAQLTAGRSSEGEKNSEGSGLITDASERQSRRSDNESKSEGSDRFAENRERGDGKEGGDEGRRESREGSRKGKEGNRGKGRGDKAANNPAQASTNPTTNPAGNVPAGNAASNSAASAGVNPAGNPVTPGNPSGPANANNPAQASTNPTTNPAGNVPAGNAASNSAASAGVNPAGNPVTPGNPSGPANANNPAQASTNPTTNPAGNVPAGNAASNSAASAGVNPAGNPVTPGNPSGPANANNPAQASTNPTTNPAGNVPAGNAASNSAASAGVNPAGNPVTPGNPSGPANANNPAQASTNPTTNPAGNVPAGNAASNSAASAGVNPAGNPVTPGNPSGPANANNPAQASTNPTTNPAGNVPAGNAASNSAASAGVNPAGNPVTPGNPSGPANANNPAQASTNPTTNPAGNVPAGNAASNSAASAGVNPAGNPVTPGNPSGPANANNPAQASTNPTTNPAGNVPAGNAASNSAASAGVNPAGNPVTPGNPSGPANANNPAQASTNPTTNPAGNVPAGNAASNSAASAGVNPAGNPVTPGNPSGPANANNPAQASTNPTTNPAGNLFPVSKDQVPYVNSQYVTLKPGVEPIIEKGYSIKPQLNNVDIKPLRTVDPVYRAPGPITGTSSFNVNVRGSNLPYQVSTSENGLQIKPLSPTAAKYAESNRSTVLKGAVNNAVDTLSATPGSFKTIYMDFN